MPWGNVDEEAPNLAPRDGLQVLANGADVPALDERCGRLGDGPCQPNEGEEATASLFRANPTEGFPSAEWPAAGRAFA